MGLGMLCYEDGIWVLTTYGVGKVEPPQTFAEMRVLAEKLLPEDLAAAIAQAEPFGDVAFHKYPMTRWRRYDKLDRFPAGIVPLGDAVASFDPTYGQGMTMTSLQAGHLRRALQSAPDDPAARTQPGHRKNHLSGMGDEHDRRLHLPSRRRGRSRGGTGRSEACSTSSSAQPRRDPVLAEWFLRRFSLLDSLYMTPSPALVGRTIKHNMRLWLGERRELRRERRQSRRKLQASSAAR